VSGQPASGTEDTCDPTVGCLIDGQPPEDDFQLRLGFPSAGTAWTDAVELDPMEMVLGPQLKHHVDVNMRFIAPPGVSGSPLQIFLWAELDTPCCSGQFGGEELVPDFVIFEVAQGVYQAGYTIKLNEQDLPEWIGKTGCVIAHVDLFEDGVPGQPTAYSAVTRQVFSVVDEFE
jgi:hypothetical protein